MSQLSVEMLFDELTAAHPCPEDEFESAVWHQEMMHLFEELLGCFTLRHQKLLDVIQSEVLVSDIYCVHTPKIPVREVDVDKLRSTLPEVFDSVVYVRCSDAQRFIGRRRLYELSREFAGVCRVAKHEQVNLGDLAKLLSKDEFEEFVCVTVKPGRTHVARIDSLESV